VELLFLRQFTQPRSYGGLLLEVVSAGVVYGVAFLCFVMARQSPGGRLRLRLADLWQQASGR